MNNNSKVISKTMATKNIYSTQELHLLFKNKQMSETKKERLFNSNIELIRSTPISIQIPS